MLIHLNTLEEDSVSPQYADSYDRVVSPTAISSIEKRDMNTSAPDPYWIKIRMTNGDSYTSYYDDELERDLNYIKIISQWEQSINNIQN